MTYIAQNARTGELVRVSEADPEAKFECPDCESSVAYVRDHTRENCSARIPAHFRFYKCECVGTYNPDSDRSGSSGGGGGGEDAIHIRRKWMALEAISERYDGTQAVEEYVGDKRADAVLYLDEPHEKYGKGFVLEYQHKNEGKDIVATERYYAKKEMTTLWLWEDQFTDLSGVPTIHLFEGRVQTPWPYAVPADWQVDHLPSDRYRMQVAVGKHPPKTSVPRRTLAHWTWPSAREYWKAAGWDAGFRERPSDRYRMQVAVGKHPPKTSVPRRTLAHWTWPSAREYWKAAGWDAGFRHKPDRYLNFSKGSLTQIEVHLPDPIDDYPPEGPRGPLSCKDCQWRGGHDDYGIRPREGDRSGRAVCPECDGQMRLSIAKGGRL